MFVKASDIGFTAYEAAPEISGNPESVARLKELRGRGAQYLGLCTDYKLVDKQSPGLPFVVLVAAPAHDGADINARLMFLNLCHDTMAGTGAVCLGAASRVPGSVPAKILSPESSKSGILRINHPAGLMPIRVDVTLTEGTPVKVDYNVLAFERTSRRILTGTVFIPKSVWNGFGADDATNGIKGPKTVAPKKTSLLLTGDINLQKITDADAPFRKVKDSLMAADVVISNLECLLAAPQKAHSIDNEGFFADPIVSTKVLTGGGIAAVGIANNINYGAANILGSIATLDEMGMPHTGAGENISAARKPVIIERGGRRYGFLQRTSVYWPTDHAADEVAAGIAPMPGHTAYEAHMYRYSPAIPPVNRPGIPPLVTTWADAKYLASYVDDIKLLRPQVDVLIASNHWGLGREPLKYMEDIAKAAIDAGADVVMGHGPHYSLPVGFYRNKPIFYGLGSFSFYMGHLGTVHGDWVGMLASLDLSNSSTDPEVSFRFVRHNNENETFLSHPDDEIETFNSLQKLSRKYGAELAIVGDSVVAKPL